MEKTEVEGITLLERLKDGMEILALIYQGAIQDGILPPFDPEENPELYRLWQEFRRAIELGNETRTVVALRQMLEAIMANLSPNTPHVQNG